MRRLLVHSVACGQPCTTSFARLRSVHPQTLRRCQHSNAQESRLPRIAQPSFWDSIFPKSLRSKAKESTKPSKQKTTNPATYFIWIYILIGSQAIRIMGVKNEHMQYSRKADLKLQQLREVVGKLQRGEEVDVEKALGTGDETQEREWEEAFEELRQQDRVWQSNREKVKEDKIQEQADSLMKSPDHAQITGTNPAILQPRRTRSPGFY